MISHLSPILRKHLLRASLLILLLSLAGCAAAPEPAQTSSGVLALTGATLIDGTGAAAVSDAVILIQGERILAVGPRASASIPRGAQVIDLKGGYLLPGLINAHVHYGFDEKNLQAWAAAGVTSVRDEGAIGEGTLKDLLDFRDKANQNPKNARLISGGSIMTVPGGYGAIFVESVEDARKQVAEELDLGVDLIKISMEDGYAGKTGLPKLSEAEISAIVETAHARKVKVSGHITQARYMDILVKAGLDDIAHIPYDPASEATWKEMVRKNIYLTPTFTVLRNYGAPVETCVQNLRGFLAQGGQVALGNDYGGGPGSFELGLPLYEIERMAEAGMTPMQVIVASTRNAAIVSGIQDQTGTLQSGKVADILVLAANPLDDLKHLADVRMVIHNGVLIRDEGA